ncbi:MAG: cell division protein ZapA [Acidobacteria bacterium]|nr:cell division protein ZapA [Acidobacteriota bacterium]
MQYSELGITKVKILNQVYSIRSDDDPAYVRELAAYVSDKLERVAKATPTVDTLKVAILAALNIADELFRTRREESSDTEWYREKLRQYDLLLDEFKL